MIIINDKTNETEYNVKTDFKDEITTGEFQEMDNIFSDDSLNPNRKYVNMMPILGLPEPILKRVGSTTLMLFIEQISKPFTKPKLQEEYILNGNVYNLELEGKGKKLQVYISALDQADIEDIFKANDQTIIKTIEVLLKPALEEFGANFDSDEDELIDQEDFINDIKSLPAIDAIAILKSVGTIIEKNFKIFTDENKH